MSTKEGRIPVVVVTAHRCAVYFGYVSKPWPGVGPIVLKDGRNCCYWPCGIRGAEGLAVSGPGPGSRVTPACTQTISDPVRCLECNPAAIPLWEAGPWT